MNTLETGICQSSWSICEIDEFIKAKNAFETSSFFPLIIIFSWYKYEKMSVLFVNN